jgi:hypothetical protein
VEWGTVRETSCKDPPELLPGLTTKGKEGGRDVLYYVSFYTHMHTNRSIALCLYVVFKRVTSPS